MTITAGSWYERLGEDLRLHDYRATTQASYLQAVRSFMEHAGGREPAELTEDDVRAYALYLRDERKVSASTSSIALCALRFFFEHTVRRQWAVFDLVRVKRPRTLPVVLSRGEVRRLLGSVREPVRRVALTTIYALGLRLNEGLALEAGDVDSARLKVWVRDGKGGKQRGVPLPRPLLGRLREYWKTDRPPATSRHLFPSRGGDGPLHDSTLQKTFAAVLHESDIEKKATIHTLRHSYATHLLEAGISLRTIQDLLGHSSLRTTSVYMHVTDPAVEQLQKTLDVLMLAL